MYLQTLITLMFYMSAITSRSYSSLMDAFFSKIPTIYLAHSPLDDGPSSIPILKDEASLELSARKPYPCQHFKSLDNKFPPTIPHRFLKKTELNMYDEIMVIGDLHGNFDEFQLLLKQANATSDRVLKIITGDLTRGGPKSLEVLNYVINSPSVISVRGNNDEQTLQNYHYHRQGFGINSTDFWVRFLTTQQLYFLRELPYTISLPSLNIIVVHAGLIPGIPIQHSSPYDIMNLRTLIPAPYCTSGFAPTRNITNEGKAWASVWKGPQKIIFGHDHVRMLQVYPMAIGIDTSCDRGLYLTGLFISGHRSGHFVHQPALAKHYPPRINQVKARNRDLIEGFGLFEKVPEEIKVLV